MQLFNMIYLFDAFENVTYKMYLHMRAFHLESGHFGEINEV